MKQFELKTDDPLFKVNANDFANFFKCYQNTDGSWKMNINRTLVIMNKDYLRPAIYTYYEVKYGDSWTLISYNYYGTIELWWVICKFNGITDPTISPVEGEKLIIPNKSIVDSIVKQLKKS